MRTWQIYTFTFRQVRFNALLYTGFITTPPPPKKMEALACFFDRVIVKIFLFDMKRWKNFEGKKQCILNK